MMGMLIFLCVVLSIAHFAAATEYAKAKKMPAFVAFALAFFMLFGWPLFAVGMLFAGYGAFWLRTWPEKEPKRYEG